MKKRFAGILLVGAAVALSAQGFGFGDDDTGGAFEGGGTALAVSIGGEAAVSAVGFFDEFADGAGAVQLGSIFSGKLNFSAEGSGGVGVINLNIQPTDQPIEIDEAYVRAYFGKVDVEGGIRKLTWGKADSMGPLDVINPIDYSDLTDLSDMMNLKIARPLVHISLFLGQFSKLEGVFVPWFEPKRFSDNGRWWPQQLTDLDEGLKLLSGNTKTLSDFQPDTLTLDYAQAGLRFTTTIGGAADIGVQYYYGRLTTPAVTTIPTVTVAYNPYHQIGLDYAQVVAGFNVRAELAANITGDLKGDDAAVYNPSVAWSFGFDRDFFGINLNLQANESIRLFDGNITSPLDIEADSDITSTQIIGQLAKKFMQDKLELNARVRWEVEAGSCIIMPGISWTNNDVTAELSTGIFTGMDDSFVKIGVKYAF